MKQESKRCNEIPLNLLTYFQLLYKDQFGKLYSYIKINDDTNYDLKSSNKS